MESLSRVILFFKSFFTILIITSILEIESKYSQSGIFLLASLILGVWLYYLQFIKKSSKEFLKEIIGIMIFLCLITSLWAFLTNF